MFKFLKEKIGNWVKNISKDKEDEVKEETKEEIKDKNRTKPAKKIKEQEIKKEIEEITIKPGQKEPEHEKTGFFRKITEKITKTKISEEEFEVYSEELKMLLLENNVAFEVADRVIEELKEEILEKEILKKELENEIKDSLKKIITNILIESPDLLNKISEKTSDSKEPYVILFVGINGTGKTTTIAKIANFLKKKNLSCVIAAADTFRAASIEQLQKHGENIGIKIISQQYGADPASVGFDAIQYAKKNLIKVVLIDTAGRMHTAKNLMKEIEKISNVCKPDLKLFVGESITGNDAVEQAKSFNWSIGIDGIVLTKADVDEKGGTALSVGYVTKKPIFFLGTGQEYSKIEPFNKQKFLRDIGL